MTDEIARRRQHRRAFLRHLYEQTGANVNEFVRAAEVAAPLRIEPGDLASLIAYLEEKQWVAVDDHRIGLLRITALGIDRVEELEGG